MSRGLAGIKIEREGGGKRTLFANEAVIAVIGVVRVPCDGAASVAYDSEVELCRDNAVSYPRGEEWRGQTRTVLGQGHNYTPRNSWPKRPE